MYPFVYIIILNWHGWHDTIECLESVFRTGYPNYRVIVCDNKSTDNSYEHIKAWARGDLNVHTTGSNPLRGLSFPPIPKPVQYAEYDRQLAENGGDFKESAKLVLIQNGDNLGFAGGNNVGLRYAMARADFEYIWLLNNDTVVHQEALSALIQRLKEKRDAGMCGSTLLYYDDPKAVQSLGGATYNKWLGTNANIRPDKEIISFTSADVESKMDYIIGASLLISRRLIDKIGLMDESYFLYYEELDLALRASGLFSLAYAPQSIVYHKEGQSIGTNSKTFNSYTSDYYVMRNKFRFTKKHYPLALPTVYISVIIALLNRIRRRQWDRIPMMLKILCGRS